MKLYAKVTSERASKGQGGNEYISIELLDEEKCLIAQMRYSNFHLELIDADDMLVFKDFPRERFRSKGERQKGEWCENCQKETVTDKMGTCSNCKHDK